MWKKRQSLRKSLWCTWAWQSLTHVPLLFPFLSLLEEWLLARIFTKFWTYTSYDPYLGDQVLSTCQLWLMWRNRWQNSSVQFSCVWLFMTPMDFSMPGCPDHHQLKEFPQTHVHRVGDAIQPSHLRLPASPPSFNLSQKQGLFQWVSSSH